MQPGTVAHNVFVLEGGIAAGKTTLVQTLAERYGLTAFYEPVAENPYLARFYEDPKRWALEMQLWFFERRLETYKSAVEAAKTCKGVLLDRSVFGDYAFALNSYNDGSISEEGFKRYTTRYEEGLVGLPLPAAIIYLDVQPEVCLDRILNIRKRECEAGIPLSYLQGLDAAYRVMLERTRAWNCVVIVQPWEVFGEASDIYDLMVVEQERHLQLVTV